MAVSQLTNMCMICDPNTGKVLAQRRAASRSWPGVCFPGGHVEPGESFEASVIREVLEETGLHISNLQFCGIVHWDNLNNGDQFIVYLYRTQSFQGQLIQSDEGENFWTDLENFLELDLCENFREQFPMFLREEPAEMYIPHYNENRSFEYHIQ